jgi:hypothetical protein
MKVIFDFTVLYVLGEEKGKYPVHIDAAETELINCFHALSAQYPILHEKLKKVKLIKEDGEINAMMISDQQLLKPDTKITDNQEIKVVGQICGG